jgi:cell wall-associated NlpC family hydrolase
MPWTDDYIGIAFAFDGRTRQGCDCWGLVRIVYAEQLGVELPQIGGAYTEHSTASLRRIHAAAAAEAQRWHEVKAPEPFDVVLLRRGKVNAHVGIVCGRKQMLHIQHGINAMVEPYNGLQWRHHVAGFYRYAK